MNYWKRALSINIKVILTLVLILIIFSISPFGRGIYKTFLLVSQTAPNFPVRPLEYFAKEPDVSEVSYSRDGVTTIADLYLPGDSRKHPAIILTLGTLVNRKSDAVVDLSNALAKIGYVVLIPELPEFVNGLIWTDSVNSLIASYNYLDSNLNVINSKIGFVGFCAGASVAMVAAENTQIFNKVAFISAISPFYDGNSMVKATLLNQQILDGRVEVWRPAKLTQESLNQFFMNVVENQDDKKVLAQYLDSRQNMSEEDFNKLSADSQNIYNFIKNSQAESFESLREQLPKGIKEALSQVSPSNNISRLKAKVLILNDKKDTFVPRSEGFQFVNNLPREQLYFKEVDSFEHVSPATNLPRWAAIRQIWHLGSFLYKFIKETS